MTDQQVPMREFLEQRMTQQDTTLAEIKSDVSEVKVEVKLTNGRLRKAEIAIALLQWAYGIGAAIAAGYFFEWIKR